MACLSSLFNCCIKEKKFERENPTTGIERFEETKRERILTPDDARKLVAACRRAKISGLRIHDLRHTFATWLVTEGKVDLVTVKELGGWKSLEMVERYANPSEEHKRRAIASIHFTTLFTTPENPEVVELPQAVEKKISRDVAQSGSAPEWGSGGREFESRRPDQSFQ